MGAAGRGTRARGAAVGDRDDAHRARRGVRVPRLPAVHAGVRDRLLAGGRAALAPVRRAALLPQADGGFGGLRERRADRSVSVPDVAAHRQLVVRGGFHAGFDYAALTIVGAPNSGNGGRPISDHLLVTTFTGPDWLTGGPRGIEASLLVFPVIAALFVLFHRRYRAAAAPL